MNRFIELFDVFVGGMEFNFDILVVGRRRQFEKF
jgi:hypothetical protein